MSGQPSGFTRCLNHWLSIQPTVSLIVLTSDFTRCLNNWMSVPQTSSRVILMIGRHIRHLVSLAVSTIGCQPLNSRFIGLLGLIGCLNYWLSTQPTVFWLSQSFFPNSTNCFGLSQPFVPNSTKCFLVAPTLVVNFGNSFTGCLNPCY